MSCLSSAIVCHDFDYLIIISICNLKMFVRMLTVHCDQNNSYEITINGFQVRKINEIRNGYLQVLNLVNIQTSALTLRKVSHSGDRKLRFLFRFLT